MKICITHADSPLAQRLLALLEQSDLFDTDDTLILACSLPHNIRFGKKNLQARPLTSEDFAELDLILNTSDVFTQQVLLNLSPDTYVIDLTGHLTQSKYTTLVDLAILDQIKIDSIKTILPLTHIIASGLTVSLKPILKTCDIEYIAVSTYQAVSDAGKEAMMAIDKERKHDDLHLHENPQYFEQYIYSNIIPSVGTFLSTLDTTEEEQIKKEVKQILKLEKKDVEMSVTCMRVPMKIGHVISVNLLLVKEVSLDVIKKALHASELILLVDKPVNITPKDSIGHQKIIMSRLRINGRAISFVLTYDNLTYKASSALEIAKKILQ